MGRPQKHIVEVGEVFNRLTVLRTYSKEPKSPRRGLERWCEVLCVCGVKKQVRVNKIVSGNTKSCGCLQNEVRSQNAKKGAYQIKIGDTFSMLTVILERYDAQKKKTFYVSTCACGNKKTIVADAYRLFSGHTKSCGCLQKLAVQRIGLSNRVRDKKLKGVANSFFSAKNRCENKLNPAYKRYGGRNIKFLFQTVEDLYNELGERPEGTQLDRIDNNGNYEPGNVRWATPKENNRNRRSSYFWFVYGNKYTSSYAAAKENNLTRYQVETLCGVRVTKTKKHPECYRLPMYEKDMH